MLCTKIVFDIQNNFCAQHILPMFYKKKSFWQRFTCKEKGTKFSKIFTLFLSYVMSVKSKVKISQNFVTFPEYINFKNESYVFLHYF